MTRYIGPRLKLYKKLGFLYGFSTIKKIKVQKKENNLFKVKKYDKFKKIHKKFIRNNSTSYYLKRYLIDLINNKKIRILYGISKKQLLIYKQKSKYSKSSLFKLLESRLDSTLFRLGFFKSIPTARQAVSHKHVNVNGKLTYSPSYHCKSGDKISIDNSSKLKLISLKNIEAFQKKASWLNYKIKNINLLTSNESSKYYHLIK